MASVIMERIEISRVMIFGCFREGSKWLESVFFFFSWKDIMRCLSENCLYHYAFFVHDNDHAIVQQKVGKS